MSNRSQNEESGYTGEEAWRNISNRQITKSWGGMINFMHSYGLKEYNPEDFDTAHQIIDQMKQHQWDDMTPAQRDQARAHQAKYKY